MNAAESSQRSTQKIFCLYNNVVCASSCTGRLGQIKLQINSSGGGRPVINRVGLSVRTNSRLVISAQQLSNIGTNLFCGIPYPLARLSFLVLLAGRSFFDAFFSPFYSTACLVWQILPSVTRKSVVAVPEKVRRRAPWAATVPGTRRSRYYRSVMDQRGNWLVWTSPGSGHPKNSWLAVVIGL